MTSYATSRRFWTTHEVALLERLYPNLATVEVATRLDRPLSAVHGKAKALGEKKMKCFGLAHSQADLMVCKVKPLDFRSERGFKV